jgi:asparagine synthase (glutamine-hydrolysing)
MERLRLRGPDGSNMVSVDNTTMGYWHFWTTPEEVNECQPLKLKDLPFRIVFDGRIDNRDELFARLAISPSEGRTLSDAALTLRAYARWGEDCFQDFVGEFALVIFNEHLKEIIAARDPLGDRTLFYAFFGTQLVIASEPWAVAGAGPSKPTIEESAVAQYFAVRVPQDGQTFFKNIFELLPAHILKVNAAERRSWRYWSPDPYKKIRYKNDKEYVEHFRSLLEESIRSRMRSCLTAGVLMSGGLDSTSVACLAAEMIAPKTLTTVSYVFDEFTACDERQYIESVEEKYGIHSIQIPCDDVWTFKNWENWPQNPNRPGGNPYRMILERVYKHTQEEGVQVLLTGYMGDHLYSAGSDWIADLIVDRQFSRAWKELIFQIENRGWKRALKTGHIRRTARRVIDAIRPGAMRLPHRGSSLPSWIDPAYKSCFTSHTMLNPVFERHGTLLSLEASNDLAHTFRNTNRYQIELRNPFRDRRLIEFILAIPAYQLYCHGAFKPILRVAMQDILPEIIRTRSTKTSFVPLYQRGVESERELLDSYLEAPKAEWRKFVRADWSSKMSGLTQVNGKEGLLPFLCASYEVWHQAFVSENLLSM